MNLSLFGGDLFCFLYSGFHCIMILLVYKNSCLCAASLKNCGPCLISHSLCEWIINTKYSPLFIDQLLRDNESWCCSFFIVLIHVCKYFLPVPSHLTGLLDPLLKLLPDTLSKRHLLVHCAWQAAYASNVCNY